MNKIVYLSIGISLMSCTIFKKKDTNSKLENTSTASTESAISNEFLNLNNIDHSVKLGDDFYNHQNGTWLKTNEIPQSETIWGSFQMLRDKTLSDQKKILDELSQSTTVFADGSKEQKIRDYYNSYMDESAIENSGIQQLQPYLNKIENAKNQAELFEVCLDLYRMGLGSGFSFGIGVDDKNVNRYVPQFSQGGLGMPDRDYYLKADNKFETIRQNYQSYIEKISSYISNEDPHGIAERIFQFERVLAENSMDRVSMRDPEKMYNKYSIKELDEKIPVWDWTGVLKKLGVSNAEFVLIGQPKFFMEYGKIIGKTDLVTLKLYFKYHLINDFASVLPSTINSANFDFYGKVLSGQKEQKPRWKRALGSINGNMGELFGQIYVSKYFSPTAKQKMVVLVKNLQNAYENRINNLTWMSSETKKAALEKLHSFTLKIGYPDVWKNYNGLKISPNSIIENIINASKFEYDNNIIKMGRPVDKTEWYMSPQTVNAYYNPSFNEIVFPAAILQFPFFDENADDAVNYGGIGAVIGHEMTHGFDDQGAQYAADGNLKNWWSDNDKEKFEALTKKVVEQYNSFVILDTVHVQGELTLGENIADFGGVCIAYDAFKNNSPQAKNNTKIDDLGPYQRFYMSWAQIWRANITPQAALQRILTDPHSPGIWRCNGPIMNHDQWYEAFGIKETDKMYKPSKNRIRIW